MRLRISISQKHPEKKESKFQNTESVCMMRRTFLTSALDMPEIMSYIYSKSWKHKFSASSSIIIIEDYYLQTFLHSL